MATGLYLLDHRNPHGDHFYRTRRQPLLAIVVHVTAGLEDLDGVDDHSAENTAAYAASTVRDVSWHSGSDADSWVDLLPYSYTGWHCVGYNSATAGHEISKRTVDWASAPAAWVDKTLRMAAVGPDGRTGLAKKAHDNRIPLRRATRAELDHAIANGGPPVGFVAHADLDPARRTDPGKTFPWSRFFGLMTGGSTPTQTPAPEEDDVAKILTITGPNAKAKWALVAGDTVAELRDDDELAAAQAVYGVKPAGQILQRQVDVAQAALARARG